MSEYRGVLNQEVLQQQKKETTHTVTVSYYRKNSSRGLPKAQENKVRLLTCISPITHVHYVSSIQQKCKYVTSVTVRISFVQKNAWTELKGRALKLRFNIVIITATYSLCQQCLVTVGTVDFV